MWNHAVRIAHTRPAEEYAPISGGTRNLAVA